MKLFIDYCCLQDPYPSVDGSQNLSESCVSTTEGINESGPYKGKMSPHVFTIAIVPFSLSKQHIKRPPAAALFVL